jgi:hypothetical protein
MVLSPRVSRDRFVRSHGFIDFFRGDVVVSRMWGGCILEANVITPYEELRELCSSHVGPVLILFNLAHRL